MKLSPVMTRALDAASRSGALHRWPGGFWVGYAWDGESRTPARPWFSAQTIDALVNRGYLSAPEWGYSFGRAVAIVKLRTDLAPLDKPATER
jgi:hypothetical protein